MEALFIKAESDWYYVAEGELTDMEIHKKTIALKKAKAEISKKHMPHLILPRIGATNIRLPKTQPTTSKRCISWRIAMDEQEKRVVPCASEKTTGVQGSEGRTLPPIKVQIKPPPVKPPKEDEK